MITLLIATIAAGLWPLAGNVTTHLPVLALPPAGGLPSLWPPLRVVPLGSTTWSFWAADTAAVIVMLLTAWGMLRHAAAKHPAARPARAFGRALWTTIVAVAGGNIVRSVHLSFAAHADIATYLVMLAIGIVVSALTALLLGVIVGVVAALVAGARRAPITAG